MSAYSPRMKRKSRGPNPRPNKTYDPNWEPYDIFEFVYGNACVQSEEVNDGK